jgi:hypothetical protein
MPNAEAHQQTIDGQKTFLKRFDHTVTVAPSFLSVPGLDRSAPGEQTDQTAGSDDTGGILSPPKSSVKTSTSQETEAIRDGTYYWQLSA